MAREIIHLQPGPPLFFTRYSWRMIIWNIRSSASFIIPGVPRFPPLLCKVYRLRSAENTARKLLHNS